MTEKKIETFANRHGRGHEEFEVGMANDPEDVMFLMIKEYEDEEGRRGLGDVFSMVHLYPDQLRDLLGWIADNRPDDFEQVALDKFDWSAMPADASARERQLVQALRLTVEYVGLDLLRPERGWDWFEALEDEPWFPEWLSAMTSHEQAYSWYDFDDPAEEDAELG